MPAAPIAHSAPLLKMRAIKQPPATTTPADPAAGLRAWLRAWAKDHPRRGLRPAYHDARAEGWNVNHKKIQRLWRDEGLRVPQRRRRKRLGASTTPNPPSADAPNVVWAVDFQFDATTDGRPIKIVSLVDDTPVNASAAWSSATSPDDT
jgi:putative transposase